MKKQAQNTKNLETRPPIVVILGHVDHGKTSILDYIRKTKVAERESGGITQHIGAYQIEHQDKKITFIDTPGHEAFSAMRSRGAKVADIAVLVVAAEEGLKPQTKEAIGLVKKTGIPAIIALNKIDKKEALPEKVKKELSQCEILVESLGGSIPCINVSAKTGQGIDQLLEMINLVAEMEEFTYDPNKKASGVIIESNLDHTKGPIATVLIKEGELKVSDVIGTDTACGKIKSLRDFTNQEVDQAPASFPAVVSGFLKVPQIGEKFSVFESLTDAQDKIAKEEKKINGASEVQVIEADKKVLNLIIKADVLGSLEAIKQSLKAIPCEEVVCRILKAEVGQITETDIKLAESAKARIVAFRVKVPSQIQKLAENRKIRILSYEIIYELIQSVRDLLAKLLSPQIIKNKLGQVKILAKFPDKKGRQVIGGKVISGELKNNVSADIVRNKSIIGQGKITQLQRNKNDVKQVIKGQECGMLFDSQIKIEKDDILDIFEEEAQKRQL
jgi:translation initiation factor IF-2